jgi:hypothetical protein
MLLEIFVRLMNQTSAKAGTSTTGVLVEKWSAALIGVFIFGIANHAESGATHFEFATETRAPIGPQIISVFNGADRISKGCIFGEARKIEVSHSLMGSEVGPDFGTG